MLPQEAGDKAVAAYTGQAGKVIYLQADITDNVKCKAAVDTVVEKLGNLKGVVHCAGIAVKVRFPPSCIPAPCASVPAA